MYAPGSEAPAPEEGSFEIVEDNGLETVNIEDLKPIDNVFV